MAQLFRADEFVSGATLSRFYATHVILLPWVLLLLLSLHFQLVRKHGVAPVVGAEDESEGEPFFPNHMLRQLVVVLHHPGGGVDPGCLLPTSLRVPGGPVHLAPASSRPWVFLPPFWWEPDVSPAGLGLIGLPLFSWRLAVLPLLVTDDERELQPTAGGHGLFILFLSSSSLPCRGFDPGGGAPNGRQLMMRSLVFGLAACGPCR